MICRPYIACVYVVDWIVKWRHFLVVRRVIASVLLGRDEYRTSLTDFAMRLVGVKAARGRTGELRVVASPGGPGV